MITKIIMPQMSLTMRYGIVSAWLKKEGDAVSQGEPVCTIEGDKASVDIEAPASGLLLKILAQPGEEFPVKQPMAYIGEKGEEIVTEPEQDYEQPAEAQKTNTQNFSEFSNERIKASPIAQRLAKEKGIDLSQITGTGPDGLIGKEDVLSFQNIEPAEKVPANRETSLVQNSIQKVIASRMEQSNREIPHFHLSATCRMTEANEYRKKVNQTQHQEIHITQTDLMLWAVSRSLVQHTLLNSTFTEEQIVIHSQINPGVAVNTPKGLVVVVFKNANAKSLIAIAEERSELVEKAMNGKQSVGDLSDCTFTISNLGMFGIESFDPIISPGQVGILGVGATKKEIIMDEEGKITSIETATITLGCDHRVVDGVSGAEFLTSIKTLIENPENMFV